MLIFRAAPTAEDLDNLEDTVTIYGVTHIEKDPESLPGRQWYNLFNGSELIGYISDMTERKVEEVVEGEEEEC